MFKVGGSISTGLLMMAPLIGVIMLLSQPLFGWIESTKANHIDPRQYLTVLSRASTIIPAFQKSEELVAYLPWNYQSIKIRTNGQTLISHRRRRSPHRQKESSILKNREAIELPFALKIICKVYRNMVSYLLFTPVSWYLMPWWRYQFPWRHISRSD